MHACILLLLPAAVAAPPPPVDAAAAAPESDAESTSRKRIISFYDPNTPPELPVDAKEYQTADLQQQLNQLKVGRQATHQCARCMLSMHSVCHNNLVILHLT